MSTECSPTPRRLTMRCSQPLVPITARAFEHARRRSKGRSQFAACAPIFSLDFVCVTPPSSDLTKYPIVVVLSPRL